MELRVKEERERQSRERERERERERRERERGERERERERIEGWNKADIDTKLESIRDQERKLLKRREMDNGLDIAVSPLPNETLKLYCLVWKY